MIPRVITIMTSFNPTKASFKVETFSLGNRVIATAKQMLKKISPSICPFSEAAPKIFTGTILKKNPVNCAKNPSCSPLSAFALSTFDLADSLAS